MRRIIALFALCTFFSANLFSQKTSTPEMLDKVLSAVVTVAVYETDVAMKPLGFRGSSSDLAYAKALDLSSSKAAVQDLSFSMGASIMLSLMHMWFKVLRVQMVAFMYIL